jgi:hypothetical protein
MQPADIGRVVIERDVASPDCARGVVASVAAWGSSAHDSWRSVPSFAAPPWRYDGGHATSACASTAQTSSSPRGRVTGFQTSCWRLALVAKSHGVRIVGAMAPCAVRRQVVIELASAVATLAGQLAVLTEQREAGFLFMVEPRGAPVSRRMAIAAVVATLAAVRVVGGVATDRFWALPVAATQMTAAALNDWCTPAGKRVLRSHSGHRPS